MIILLVFWVFVTAMLYAVSPILGGVSLVFGVAAVVLTLLCWSRVAGLLAIAVCAAVLFAVMQ